MGLSRTSLNEGKSAWYVKQSCCWALGRDMLRDEALLFPINRSQAVLQSSMLEKLSQRAYWRDSVGKGCRIYSELIKCPIKYCSGKTFTGSFCPSRQVAAAL